MKISEIEHEGQILPDEDEEGNESEKPKINMEIGVGLYDVLNPDGLENKKIESMVPQSTEQIVKISKAPKNGSSDSDSSSSEDENLYMNFDSSDSENEIVAKI